MGMLMLKRTGERGEAWYQERPGIRITTGAKSDIWSFGAFKSTLPSKGTWKFGKA